MRLPAPDCSRCDRWTGSQRGCAATSSSRRTFRCLRTVRNSDFGGGGSWWNARQWTCAGSTRASFATAGRSIHAFPVRRGPSELPRLRHASGERWSSDCAGCWVLGLRSPALPQERLVIGDVERFVGRRDERTGEHRLVCRCHDEPWRLDAAVPEETAVRIWRGGPRGADGGPDVGKRRSGRLRVDGRSRACSR